MIELAPAEDIAFIRTEWELLHGRYSAKSYWNKPRTAEKAIRQESVNKIWPVKRDTKPAARKKAKNDAENERWERIWKEKLEDKTYYAR